MDPLGSANAAAAFSAVGQHSGPHGFPPAVSAPFPVSTGGPAAGLTTGPTAGMNAGPFSSSSMGKIFMGSIYCLRVIRLLHMWMKTREWKLLFLIFPKYNKMWKCLQY